MENKEHNEVFEQSSIPLDIRLKLSESSIGSNTPEQVHSSLLQKKDTIEVSDISIEIDDFAYWQQKIAQKLKSDSATIFHAPNRDSINLPVSGTHPGAASNRTSSIEEHDSPFSNAKNQTTSSPSIPGDTEPQLQSTASNEAPSVKHDDGSELAELREQDRKERLTYSFCSECGHRFTLVTGKENLCQPCGMNYDPDLIEQMYERAKPKRADKKGMKV